MGIALRRVLLLPHGQSLLVVGPGLPVFPLGLVHKSQVAQTAGQFGVGGVRRGCAAVDRAAGEGECGVKGKC